MGAASVGDVAVFAGGYTGSGSSSTVDFYDGNGTHTAGAPLGTARQFGAATAVGDFAIIAGGSTGSWGSNMTKTTAVDFYDKNGTHSIGTPLGTGRDISTATTAGKLAIVAGGQISTGQGTDVTDYYDENGTRSDGTPMSAVKLWMNSTTVNDLAIFPGGSSPSGYSASAVVDYYNESGERIDGTPLTQARWGPQAAAVGNLAIVAGGATEGHVYVATADYYEFEGITKTSIVIPANSKYKFDGIHSAEQSAAVPTPFSANQPISGYIKIGAQTLSGQQNGIGLFDA